MGVRPPRLNRSVRCPLDSSHSMTWQYSRSRCALTCLLHRLRPWFSAVSIRLQAATAHLLHRYTRKGVVQMRGGLFLRVTRSHTGRSADIDHDYRLAQEWASRSGRELTDHPAREQFVAALSIAPILQGDAILLLRARKHAPDIQSWGEYGASRISPRAKRWPL